MERFAPVKRNPALKPYEGQWVAVKDGVVVAHAASSVELVPLVRALDNEGRDTAIEYVHPPVPYYEVW